LIDFDVQLWVVRKDNGKMVKIRRGPAAVIGDERRRVPLSGIQISSPVLLQQPPYAQIFWLAHIIEIKVRLIAGWEGAVSRIIRKSEDLPIKTILF